MSGNANEPATDNALGSVQPVQSYVDLRVRIRARDNLVGAYPVEAWLTDVHGSSSRTGGAYYSPDITRLNDMSGDPQAYGLHLFYSLFSGQIASVFDRAIGLAEAHAENRLRLRIWIADGAPELHAIYWERMYRQRAGIASPITTIARMPFSRYIDVAFPIPEAKPVHRIHLLYVCANPTNLESQYGLVPIDVDTEVRELVAALQSLRHTRQISVTLVPGQSGVSSTLRQRIGDLGWTLVDGPATQAIMLQLLSEEPGYQVLHFLGHGRFSRKDAAASLFFEGRSGKAHLVKDKDLGSRLQTLDTVPELVFLAACESAKRHPELGYPQVGFSPQLIRAGVRAVVAMQHRITTQTARQFTSQFYQAVLDHGVTDLAMNQARFTSFNEDERDWWVPVLSTCLEDGVLFKADTVRSMLDAMADADVFNPLPADTDYIPCEVLHVPSFDTYSTDSMLTGNRIDIGTALDECLGIPGSPTQPVKQGTQIVLLSGARGMGKSVQLRRLGYMTALDSWHAEYGTVLLPVYIDLVDGLHSVREFEALCLTALQQFHEDIDALTYDQWIRGNGPRLRFLIDGLDALSTKMRELVTQVLAQFILVYPGNQFIIVYHNNLVDLDDFNAELIQHGLLDSLSYLQIQPLSESTLYGYLRSHSQAGQQLAGVIATRQLASIATNPWVLTQLIKNARYKRFPVSQASLIRGLLMSSIDAITSDISIRSRIVQGLGEIGYSMQSRYAVSMPIDEVFQILGSIRGERTYDLEWLFRALCENDILMITAVDHARFTRDLFQTYCCALAVSQQSLEVLDNIIDAMVMPSRTAWWADVLVLLAGCGADVSSLLQRLLFSSQSRSEGMLILAARLIQESVCEDTTDLKAYVLQGLVHQLTTVSHIDVRCEIVDALAGFNTIEAMRYLVLVATGLTNGDLGLPSTVRMRATNAIRRLDGPDFPRIGQLDAEFAAILGLWESDNVVNLAEKLVELDHEAGDRDLRSIAVFALADMQSEAAFDILLQAFVYPGAHESTLQAIAAAVTLVNPQWVQKLLLAFVKIVQGAPSQITQLTDVQYRRLKPHILDMVGQLRLADEILEFFVRDALVNDTEFRHKLIAIRALGQMRDTTANDILIAIALGDMTVLTSEPCYSEANLLCLRRTAIRTLAITGDQVALDRLASLRYHDEFGHELYVMTEAIVWRQHAIDL